MDGYVKNSTITLCPQSPMGAGSVLLAFQRVPRDDDRSCRDTTHAAARTCLLTCHQSLPALSFAPVQEVDAVKTQEETPSQSTPPHALQPVQPVQLVQPVQAAQQVKATRAIRTNAKPRVARLRSTNTTSTPQTPRQRAHPSSSAAAASRNGNGNGQSVCPSGQHRRGLVRQEILRQGSAVLLSEAESADMEVGIFNSILHFATCHNVVRSWTSPQFVALYVSKARSVLANLEPRGDYIGNLRLLTRLREGEFSPHQVADMRPENLFPERWKAALDARLRQDAYLDNSKPAAMTDLFKCRMCHKRECVYHELQLRSGDEPMSIFITCLNCGNRWRQG